MGFCSGPSADQYSTALPWSLDQRLVPLAVWVRYQVRLKNEISISSFQSSRESKTRCTLHSKYAILTHVKMEIDNLWEDPERDCSLAVCWTSPPFFSRPSSPGSGAPSSPACAASAAGGLWSPIWPRHVFSLASAELGLLQQRIGELKTQSSSGGRIHRRTWPGRPVLHEWGRKTFFVMHIYFARDAGQPWRASAHFYNDSTCKPDNNDASTSFGVNAPVDLDLDVLTSDSLSSLWSSSDFLNESCLRIHSKLQFSLLNLFLPLNIPFF